MALSKKPLVVAGSSFALLVVVLLALPLAFKGRIEARIQSQIEQAVGADVSWSAVELSLLRSFPNATLGLRDLDVVGVERFQGDTLVAMRRLRVTVGLGSVWASLRGNGPLVVRSVRLEEPRVHLRVLEDGTSSWDVLGGTEGAGIEGGAAAGPAPEGGAGLAVRLQALEVTEGVVRFEDASTGLTASLEGLRHTLSGDFSRESLVANTNTHADRATLVFAGTPYLPGVALDFDADLAVEPGTPRIEFQDNELRLNALVLRFSGAVAKIGEELDLDVTFEAPSTDFRQILSMVPAVYAADFQSLETEGRFAMNGNVRGRYGPDAFPAFSLRAVVDDGSFRYPDLPLPARAIGADLALDNPGGDLDSTVVRLSRFHVEIGDQPLDGSVTVRTPVSDPEVDADVRGSLDLGALARTVKLQDVDELSGRVTADAAFRARMSDLDSARYDRVSAEGTVSAREVVFRSAALRQPVAVDEMALQLSPSRVGLQAFRAQLGSSDLEATGEIDNLLGFVLRDEPLRGTGTFHSDRFVLDEWRSGNELQAIPVPAMLDLTLDGTVDRLTFGTLEMSDAAGNFRVQDERLTLEPFGFRTLGGAIGMRGHYETTDPERPTFAMDVALDSLDVAGASAAFLTVRTLAPVARYAQGTFSSDLALSGALTRDLAPVLDVLEGDGSLLTSRIAIEGFPLLERLASLVPVPELGHPTLTALRSTIQIRNGRLHVQPFDVGLAGLQMTVSGSSGIDQSLDYRLAMAVPRTLLGGGADRFLQQLAGTAGRAGLNVAAGETVQVGVRVAGTVGEPALDVGLGDAATSARSAVAGAVSGAVGREVDEARERVDATTEEARRRAQARADSVVADAERAAEAIRSEASGVAAQIRAEGGRRAAEVLAQATNPLARAAAQPVADRIRSEADARATQIEREADERAEALVTEARERAAGIAAGGG